MTRPVLRVPPAMTFEEFQAFAAARPDGERWELVDGQAVLNASPTDIHQIIVANVTAFLLNHANAHETGWLPLPGHSVPVPGVPKENAPVPDIVVRSGSLTGESYSREPVVVFEVLSTSNDEADRIWRQTAYASVPSIQHYVVIEQKAVRVSVLNRASGWRDDPIEDIRADAPLTALGLDLPLAVIYRHTGFDPRHTAGETATPQRGTNSV